MELVKILFTVILYTRNYIDINILNVFQILVFNFLY